MYKFVTHTCVQKPLWFLKITNNLAIDSIFNFNIFFVKLVGTLERSKVKTFNTLLNINFDKKKIIMKNKNFYVKLDLTKCILLFSFNLKTNNREKFYQIFLLLIYNI